MPFCQVNLKELCQEESYTFFFAFACHHEES